MYMHAHLRYAEALARFGDADGLLAALCQANPIGDDRARPVAPGRGSAPPTTRPRTRAFDDR